MGRARRVGFVIDDMVPSLGAVRAGRCGVRGLLTGSLSTSSVATMRFGWVAREVNRRKREFGLHYETYRPWRRGGYDALVFLKSMGAESRAIAESERATARIIFDVNVDYKTPPVGTFFYEGMAPTSSQRQSAMAMTVLSDAVIADSEHLAQLWGGSGSNVCWIPDNVDMSGVPINPVSFALENGKLNLFWSGEAVKLFDLLAVEDVLRSLADRVRLVIVTSDLMALDRWYDGYAKRLRGLLDVVEHETHQFHSIPHLQALYAARPGVFISPRFLDNSYNLGHTEWKITLAMACGRHVLCSPQPSYRCVSQRSGGKGVRLCEDDAAWRHALDAILTGCTDPDAEGVAGRETVERYYSTRVVAAQHAVWVRHVLEGTSSADLGRGGV